MSSTITRIRVCHIDDVVPGSMMKFAHGDRVLVIYNVDGEFYATDNACTHGPGELSEGELYGDIIECNFHGGQFNVRTGEVAGPPCIAPIKTYAVTVQDGQVFVFL